LPLLLPNLHITWNLELKIGTLVLSGTLNPNLQSIPHKYANEATQSPAKGMGVVEGSSSTFAA